MRKCNLELGVCQWTGSGSLGDDKSERGAGIGWPDGWMDESLGSDSPARDQDERAKSGQTEDAHVMPWRLAHPTRRDSRPGSPRRRTTPSSATPSTSPSPRPPLALSDHRRQSVCEHRVAGGPGMSRGHWNLGPLHNDTILPGLAWNPNRASGQKQRCSATNSHGCKSRARGVCVSCCSHSEQNLGKSKMHVQRPIVPPPLRSAAFPTFPVGNPGMRNMALALTA